MEESPTGAETAYPDASDAKMIISGHFYWLLILLSTSAMNVICAAGAIFVHYCFDQLLHLVIPDSLSLIRQTLTAASAAAFATISVVLLGEMVILFWKFRDPQRILTSIFAAALKRIAEMKTTVEQTASAKAAGQ